MRAHGLSTTDIVTGLVLIGVALGGVIFKLTHDAGALEARIIALEAVQDRRPDIVFMDYSGVGELLALGADPAELEPILAGLGEQEQLLVEAGYVVLNTSALIGGPERLIVPAPGAQALEARLTAVGQGPGSLADTAEIPQTEEDLDALGLRLFDALDAGVGEGGS